MYYGKKVMLRSLELKDARELSIPMNDVEVRQTVANIQPLTVEEREIWIRNSWKSRSEDKNHVYAISTFEGDWLGYIYLSVEDKISTIAEMGIVVPASKKQGKGYGTDAIRIILALGFRELYLHRI